MPSFSLTYYYFLSFLSVHAACSKEGGEASNARMVAVMEGIRSRKEEERKTLLLFLSDDPTECISKIGPAAAKKVIIVLRDQNISSTSSSTAIFSGRGRKGFLCRHIHNLKYCMV